MAWVLTVVLDVTYETHPPLSSIVGLGLSVNVTSTQQLTQLTEVFFRVRGPDVATTNATLQPVFDWVSINPGANAAAGGSVHPSFYSCFTTWLQEFTSLTTPVWIGGRLISRDAFVRHSAKLADLAVNVPPYTARILNIIGGGVIDDIDPASTGLNPQWCNGALVNWNPTVSWTADTPKDTIELYKTTAANITQELGKVAGLDHAAYPTRQIRK
ncbi:hypothetical protein FRC07_010475 [Ceratobasidium sp. 392]|nr:hypothetical protein FRC07_010475 [Ceratobasidium sp. 392]